MLRTSVPTCLVEWLRAVPDSLERRRVVPRFSVQPDALRRLDAMSEAMDIGFIPRPSLVRVLALCDSQDVDPCRGKRLARAPQTGRVHCRRLQ